MQNVYLVPRQLGIHGTQKGYFYLAEAIQMALENEKNLLQFSKIMFGKIAQKYDTEPANVDRNIRTLLDQCWNSSFREELQKMASYRLEKKPTVGEFIDIVYWYVKNLEEEDSQERS